MSRIKEPHFFSPDFPVAAPLTREQYDQLFQDAADYPAVGEASVWYLLSRYAVPQINREFADARFIVMLRNPVEMAPSLHWQLVYNGDEDVREFEVAWALQEERANGNKMPAACRAPQLVQYKDVCSLGEQVRRLFTTIERERVHLVFMDDLQSDPEGTWEEILRFLDLPPFRDIEFVPQNKSRRWRNGWVPKLGRRYYELRTSLGVPPLGLGLFNKLRELSVVEEPRSEIDVQTGHLLKQAFRDDIALLGELSGRDLSGWYAQ